MTDTNNKPTSQKSPNKTSVKKSLFIRVSLFLLLAAGIMYLTLGTIKYANRSVDDSVLDLVPKIPPATAKNRSLAQTLAKADTDLRQTLSSNQPSQKFGQKAGQLGELYHGNDFYPQALACYEIAMQYDPQNPLWPHHSAMLKQMTGETESVLGLLKRTIELDEDYHPAVLKLADIYYKMGEFDQAAIYYQKCLDFNPGDKFALVALSRIALDSSKWQQAQLNLEKAIETDPAFGAAHRLLASVHKHFGRNKMMIESLQKAGTNKSSVTPDPWIDEVDLLSFEPKKLLSMGNKLRQMQYLNLSRKFLQRALELNADDPEPFFEMGNYIFQQDLHQEARPFFEKVIQIDPQHTKAYNKLGSILLRQKKPHYAEQMFLKALQYDPEHVYSYQGLGLCRMQQGKFEEALRPFRKALEIDPDMKLLNYHLAYTLHKLGKLDQAIEHYHQQLNRQPEHEETRLHLAQALFENNHIHPALQQYRILLQTNPDSLNALNSLAWILATTEDANTKDPAQAVKLAERACEITRYKNPQILDTLAVAYAADEQFQKAIETAQKAIELARSSGNQALAIKIQKRIELYEANQPYREPLPEKTRKN